MPEFDIFMPFFPFFRKLWKTFFPENLLPDVFGWGSAGSRDDHRTRTMTLLPVSTIVDRMSTPIFTPSAVPYRPYPIDRPTHRPTHRPTQSTGLHTGLHNRPAVPHRPIQSNLYNPTDSIWKLYALVQSNLYNPLACGSYRRAIV